MESNLRERRSGKKNRISSNKQKKEEIWKAKRGMSEGKLRKKKA